MAASLAAVLAPVSIWFSAVDNTVRQPYLDEVFHVRQAQHYCQNHWDVWDPKITTPPGVYLLSYLLQPLIGCSITALRFVNVLCLAALLLAVRATYTVRRRTNHETGRLSGVLASHSALNIVLFPPLFFFSALYYTDVASTLSVMVFYWYFLKGLPTEKPSFGRLVVQVLLGLISLMFRQTDIFWVAVAPAILTTVVELDHGHKVVKESMYRRAEGFGDSTVSVAKTSWKMGVVYDPPIRDAFFEDYIRTVISLIVCLLRTVTTPGHLLALIHSLSPFITLLASFATFILLNGSVVLGDKSNHVATPNIPQILYHQTFTTFFAWPLLLPQFLLIPLVLLSKLPHAIFPFTQIEPFLVFRRQIFLPRLSLFLVFTLVATAIVYANTTVHPFLLADNRHYYFYIFRRLTNPWWIRYALCPVYILCAWATFQTRGEAATITTSSSSGISLADAGKGASPDPLASKAHSAARIRTVHFPDGRSPSTISFALTILFTTALTLCTAPLVEPRYCIVPYIFWRMHLPLYSPSAAYEETMAKGKGKGGRLSWWDMVKEYDWRVVVETIWLLAVNAVTGWVFLHKGFEWKQEPGLVQRFMW